MAITFVATGIDEMIVLILLFANAKKLKSIRNIYIGQQIGMTILLLLSLLTVYGIALISGKWIGLLGFLPIIIGLKILFFGEEEGDDEKQEWELKTKKFRSQIVSVALLALTGGAEELVIFIPYFAALDAFDTMIAALTFFVMIPIWCTVCKKISSIDRFQAGVQKYERIILPIVFIGIGLSVLIENNTLQNVMSLFK